MEFTSAYISQQGGRDENQDSCGETIHTADNLWVVADGLGGHAGGRVASQVAVKAVLDAWEDNSDLTPESMSFLIEAAQSKIIEGQSENPQLSSMRTTLVLFASNGVEILWAYIGDSRFYHIRHGEVNFQTKDHSVPQAMVDVGEIEVNEIRTHPDRNRLLKALGNPEKLKPTIQQSPVAVESGDAFLLCTDGFWEYITEEEMIVDLSKARSPGHWLKHMEVRLLRKAAEGHDNYTAFAVFVD